MSSPHRAAAELHRDLVASSVKVTLHSIRGGGFELRQGASDYAWRALIAPADYPAVAEAFIGQGLTPEWEPISIDWTGMLWNVVGRTIDAERLPEHLRP